MKTKPTKRRRWAPRLAMAILTLGLAVGTAPAALAQEPAAPAGEGSGRPLDGYFGTATLACLALFIVGKSARR